MSHSFEPHELKTRVKQALAAGTGGPLPFKQNTRKAVVSREGRAAEWPDFEQRRDRIVERRQQAVDHLDELREMLRERWVERGIVVHETANAEESRRAILAIPRERGISRILKSKSMLSEEIEINDYLEQHGIDPVETDLGEYIVQLGHEAPSHITMPGMHLFLQGVGKLFAEKLGVEYTEDPPTLTRIARKVLREKFLETEAGMVGVNFAVAHTGHIATVTNEGNGRMVSTLPQVVIALMGWERVTESLGDLAQLWQILARSATGQHATVYLNLRHGPSEGPISPKEVHVVVVDNGRRSIHNHPEMREVLRRIRCGACLNACPVYQQVGGHPYGGTYPGPIGAVLTPNLAGVWKALADPYTSTLCGACEAICPVKTPIPKLLLNIRQREVGSRMGIDPEQSLWTGFRFTMSSEKRYEAATRLARSAQHLFPKGKVPIPGWTDHRDAPALADKLFRDLFDEDEQT